MADQRGLLHKYNVLRTDGSSDPGGKHEGCSYFVLDLECDPHALVALKAYAESCADERPELSKDLIREIKLRDGEHIELLCLYCRRPKVLEIATPEAQGVFNYYCEDRDCEDLHAATL